MTKSKIFHTVGLVVLTVFVIILVMALYAKYAMRAPGTMPQTATSTEEISEFGGASAEELEQMLDAIRPEGDGSGMTPEQMKEELDMLRMEKNEGGADTSPTEETAPLTEAEITAKLNEIEQQDNDPDTTP